MSAIGTTDVINYLTNLENENAFLRSKVEQDERTLINAMKFYNVLVSAQDVASMHSISKTRVIDYAHRGLIETHPNSTDNKMYFRLSDALRWDFAELKREKAVNRVMQGHI